MKTRTKVLITVTTYPLPSDTYYELVCTAGFTEQGRWIRIYPIPLSYLKENRFRKYHWIEIDLNKRDLVKDFRPESFNPVRNDLSDMVIGAKIDTADNWAARKSICLKYVYRELGQLIGEAHDPMVRTSLATFKPAKILDFIVKPTEREWKPEWVEQQRQLNLFTNPEEKEDRRTFIQKVPYKFKYRIADITGRESTMMIEDWEIGQLYWNCLRDHGTEEAAVQKVKEKYWDYWWWVKLVVDFAGSTDHQ